MTPDDLTRLLDELRDLPHETEWVEFKEANNNFDFRKLGKYFSALSNEANLKQQACGWLVFGVVNSNRSICGSQYRENPAELDSLKREIAEQTGGMTFRDIHVLPHTDGRVVLFEIPPASRGIPVAFQGHYYGRDGESLGALCIQELEQIRSQNLVDDWSAHYCDDATLDDLDLAAIDQARHNFREKNKNRDFADEIEKWPISEFLDRAKLTKDGRIVRATLILLGKAASVHHLETGVAQLTWKLEGQEQAYEHFSPPFLLTTNELYSRIRNTLQKVDVPGQLIPLEIPKYEKWVILEALHNAIAHQDYALQSRVVVTETIDRLAFESAGSFFEGSLTDYTLAQKTPHRYRNRFLADAMVNVNMIDTMGYGIQRMFNEQRKRFYPLPDFDLSNPTRVKVTIHGKVIDPNYTAVLMTQSDLQFGTVVLLDQVQKHITIDKKEADRLRRKKLVEGRYPNVYVAAHIASAADDKAQYIKNRAFDDQHYKDLILEYLRKYKQASRKEIESLLLGKLSDILSEPQKQHKVKNLLYAMSKRDGTIRSEGAGSSSKWVLN
jgi:ATP-dependent DNA helicase RecG